MADQQDSSGKEDHVADGKAGKGIMARVNAPSDPETEDLDEAAGHPDAKPSGAAAQSKLPD